MTKYWELEVYRMAYFEGKKKMKNSRKADFYIE